MHETRRLILDILRSRQPATVEDILTDLHERAYDITSVTVRHHLIRLQKEGLVVAPQMRRRATPGRPQYTYSLTEKAQAQFPNNYQRLALTLLENLRTHLPSQEVNVILEGVADSLAAKIDIPDDLPFEGRMEVVIAALNAQGYEARWEHSPHGLILHTDNCPYHQLAGAHRDVCAMDMRFISALLGVVPRRLQHMLEDTGTACSYLVPHPNLNP